MKLFTWFKDKPVVPVIKWVDAGILVIPMSEWRKTEQLVKEMAGAAKMPIFQAMMQTLRLESPVNYMGGNATPHETIKHLGQIEGYQLALNNIEALAKLAQTQEPLVATFEPVSSQSEPE